MNVKIDDLLKYCIEVEMNYLSTQFKICYQCQALEGNYNCSCCNINRNIDGVKNRIFNFIGHHVDTALRDELV